MYVFTISSAVYAVMLQSHDKFFASQIREVVTHVPVILAALLLYGRFGVYALAGGLVVGSIVRLLIELPFLDWGYSFSIKGWKKSGDILSVARSLPAALVASGADQIVILVNKVAASFQESGVVSAVNYASKLQNVFSGLLSAALVTASYPRIAEYAANGDKKCLSALLSQIISVILLFLIPIALGSVVFSSELVQVVYARGSFGLEAIDLTSSIYVFYAFGLPFVGLFSLLNNVLYAFGQAKKAMICSLVSMGVNVPLTLALPLCIGSPGLSLASTVAIALAVVLQFDLIRPYVGLDYRSIIVEVTKILLGSLFAVSVAFLLCSQIGSPLVSLLMATIVSATVLVIVLRIMHSVTLSFLVGTIRRRIRH